MVTVPVALAGSTLLQVSARLLVQWFFTVFARHVAPAASVLPETTED